MELGILSDWWDSGVVVVYFLVDWSKVRQKRKRKGDGGLRRIGL